MSERQIELPEALRGASGGDHVLIICNNAFDAGKAAQDLYHKIGGKVTSMNRNTLFIGDGSIEFGWIETRTGRRLDDYQESHFGLHDRWDRKTYA